MRKLKKERNTAAGKAFKSLIVLCMAVMTIFNVFKPVAVQAEEINHDESVIELVRQIEPEYTCIDSQENITVNGAEFKKTVYRTHYEISGNNEYAECVDVLDLSIEQIDPQYIGGKFENLPHYFYLGNAYCRAYISYYKYQSSHSSDMATYFKIYGVSYTYLNIPSNYLLLNTNIRIDNNGMSETSGIWNQTKNTNFGTSTSGSLMGNSSWTPTCTDPSGAYVTGVMFTGTFTVNGATQYYYWNRYFYGTESY